MEYEQAVSALLSAFDDDVEQKTTYMDKLTAQMQLVVPILNDLHNAVDSFKSAPLPPPEAADKTARILAVIKLKIQIAQKSIESKIGIGRGRGR